MRKKIHKILACVDLSEYSSMVLEYSVELAPNSHIVIYNVINQFDVESFEIVKKDVLGNTSRSRFGTQGGHKLIFVPSFMNWPQNQTKECSLLAAAMLLR